MLVLEKRRKERHNSKKISRIYIRISINVMVKLVQFEYMFTEVSDHCFPFLKSGVLMPNDCSRMSCICFRDVDWIFGPF